MASLKEVKGRIASVNNTRKITSAMKMVASAKLHKAQAAIENMLPYERRLNHILTNFLSADSEVESPFIVKREVKRVAIVVFASNTSLCGGFNANIIRHLTVILDEYKSLGMENVLLYPVGRKVAEGVKKLGFKAEGDFQHMADKPSYQEAAALAEDLMRRFLHRDIDKVELLYNHFRSTAVQVLTRETYLPIDLTQEKKERGQRQDTRLYCGTVCRCGDGGIAPEGTPYEDVHGITGFECFRTCRPHYGYADCYRQCE